MEVVFYNGAFTTKNNPLISSNSRAFNYGDGFFETIKVINSKLFNFSCHMQRIKLALNLLKLHDNYTPIFFQKKILKLLKVNKIVNGSIKIHISRRGGGRYFSASNQIDLFIRVIDGVLYKKNNPISLCFYEEECKNIGSLSNIKSINSLVSVLASIYAHENDFEDAILLNASGNIIETSNANIFILRNKKIYTPPLTEGCVDGTMRKWVCNELDVFEEVILKDEILNAEEVFVSNATSGITSVKNIERMSFSSFNRANLIQQQLINSSLDL